MGHESFIWDMNHSYFTCDITTQGMGASRGSRNSKEGKMRENQARKDLIRSSRMISQTRGEVKSLDKAGRFYSRKRALRFRKRALCFRKRAHFVRQRALYFRQRALYFHFWRMISQTHGKDKSLDKAVRLLFSQKSPIFSQTSSTFPPKSPIFPQKSPIFPQKSPIFPLLAYDFANTWKSQVSRQDW